MRFFHPPDIEAYAQDRDVKRLCTALHHRDPHVRRDAAIALGGLADFFAFPECDWESDEVAAWPGVWIPPAALECEKPNFPLVLEDVLDDGEEHLVGLAVKLLRLGTVEAHYYGGNTWQLEYAFRSQPGRRAAMIDQAVGGQREWPTLVLSITGSRLLVIGGPSTWWGFPLGDVSGVRSEGRCGVVVVEERDRCVDAEEHGGLKWASGFASRATRLQLAVDFRDGDSVSFVHPNAPDVLFGKNPEFQLNEWIVQCNRYIDLVHAGGGGAERWAQFATADYRGGDRAAEALTDALGDDDEEVRSLALSALERIGGPVSQRRRLVKHALCGRTAR